METNLISTETRIATRNLIAANSAQGGHVLVALPGEEFTVQRYTYGTRVVRGNRHGFVLKNWDGFATSVTTDA